MVVEDSERPQLRYTRTEGSMSNVTDSLAEALRHARRIEELLEDTRSVTTPIAILGDAAPTSRSAHDPRAHSTRIARAMAASLVDELEALVRPPHTSRPPPPQSVEDERSVGRLRRNDDESTKPYAMPSSRSR